MAPLVTVSDALTDAEVRGVEDLLDATGRVDGTPGLNDEARLRLSHPRPGVHHLRSLAATASGSGDPRVLGYAQLDEALQVEVAAGSVVVHPDHRRQGLGTLLLHELLSRATRPLQIWAERDTAAARALAARSGLTPRRTLLIMQRPLTPERMDEGPMEGAATVQVPTPPPGVELRSFRPGVDDGAWVALNARVFAHHPEQGAITAADLTDRMAEPWFDPTGFLLAVRDKQMLGFHWTKQHPGRLGEVYVLGVDPDAGGRGLGSLLLAAGLRHLQDRGNTAVQLYVEADHERAVRLYASSGFVEVRRDVMYGQPSSAELPD